MFLGPSDVLEKGLGMVRIDGIGKSKKFKEDRFRALYGSDPSVIAAIWYDLTLGDDCLDEPLTVQEKESEKDGFNYFMRAKHYEWTYPKNSALLATMFDVGERYCRGEHVWKWIKRNGQLASKKIAWDRTQDDGQTFELTIDGTDFKVWEKKHPTLPMDRKQMSHKFKHGALKYEIGLDPFKSKVRWVYGPHRGAKHDMTIFREALKHNCRPGKIWIVDRGYRSSNDDEKMLSIPNPHHSDELKNFHARARCRHETLNGRLKNFNILNHTFRGGGDKHQDAFYSVLVTVQYQMDNGRPLFDV